MARVYFLVTSVSFLSESAFSAAIELKRALSCVPRKDVHPLNPMAANVTANTGIRKIVECHSRFIDCPQSVVSNSDHFYGFADCNTILSVLKTSLVVEEWR